jgi:hypothetical protein
MRMRIVAVTGLTLALFFTVWGGCRVYFHHQARTLLEELRALDTSSDPTNLSRTLMQKYAGRSQGRKCDAGTGYCMERFLFNNRALSMFHLAPHTEIKVTFESEGNFLRDVYAEYTCGIFKENSPIVTVVENFCPNQPVGECDYFDLDPHGRNISQTWNGEAAFTQRVKPEIRSAGWKLNIECFASFRGCKDISELLPALWKSTSPGTVSSRVRSNSDSIAEAAQPLPD